MSTGTMEQGERYWKIGKVPMSVYLALGTAMERLTEEEKAFGRREVSQRVGVAALIRAGNLRERLSAGIENAHMVPPGPEKDFGVAIPAALKGDLEAIHHASRVPMGNIGCYLLLADLGNDEDATARNLADTIRQGLVKEGNGDGQP